MNSNVKIAVENLKSQLKQLESLELYEICAKVKHEIDLIEGGKEIEYLKLKFDIAELKKCGFLEKVRDNKIHIQRICTFFGYDSIFEYSKAVTGVHLSK